MSKEQKITNDIKVPNKDLEALRLNFPHCFDKDGNFQLEKFKNNLTEKEINFSIIFTTAYNEYAIQAFKLSALDYLLKPIIPEELINAISRMERQKSLQFKALAENIQNEFFEKIAVPSGNTLILIKISDIVYIKGEGSYSEIYMQDKSKHMVSRNLKNFEEILLKDKRFLRTHKSYIVNFDEVVSFNKSDGGWLDMKNGNSIPISSEKSSLIMERIQIVKR